VKILIISSNLIGDTILSTGLIEYFTKLYPKAKFTFLIGPTASQVFKNFPNLERVINIKKRIFNFHWIKMYQCCANVKWDITVDLRSSLLSYFLTSKKRFIFKKDKNLNHVNQLEKSFSINIPDLYIYTSKEEEEIATKNLNLKYKHVVIFVGGNWIPKLWPVDSYNKLILALMNKFKNIKFILVGSYEEKKKYYHEIVKNLPNDIFLDLMGESLTLTSAYMKKSNLFVGNDSGLMHLSAASNLSTIALFGPTNDKIYGHTRENFFILRTAETYQYLSTASIDLNRSHMKSIKPEQILKIIDKNNLL
jgi:heptosyltransferase-3